MKRILFAVLLGAASISSINTNAQVSVSINIGQQPAWGPTGYDHVDYYYLPDIDSYYYVPSHQYVYLENGAWVWRNSLPSRYSGYDLYSGYKVVMNQPKPYLAHQNHVAQYGKFKNYKAKQPVIGDSRESKYSGVRNVAPARNNRPTPNSKPVQVNRSNSDGKRVSRNDQPKQNAGKQGPSRGGRG